MLKIYLFLTTVPNGVRKIKLNLFMHFRKCDLRGNKEKLVKCAYVISQTNIYIPCSVYSIFKHILNTFNIIQHAILC